MNRLTSSVALVLALAATAGAGPARSQPVDGEVTKVDKVQHRITLRHGPIKNLDMPAMSMTFRLADPSWSDRVKVGDKVKFEADKVDGYFVLIKLDRLP
jgi:Cu/Ag efflux protein CusF